jgi:hypothetical protein
LHEFIAEYKLDTVIINETHLQPTKKWRIPAYTIYQTERHRPPHGGKAVSVRWSIHYNEANVPQFTAVEVTAANIVTRTETQYINGAVYGPPSRPLLVLNHKTLI